MKNVVEGTQLDGESEGCDIDYKSDVEVQPTFAQPVQEIIHNDVTFDDNDIYTTDIDKQQVEIARERSLVASNGSGDTPTHPDDLSNIDSDNDDSADIQWAPVPARAHRGRVCTCGGARVHGFTRASGCWWQQSMCTWLQMRTYWPRQCQTRKW